MRSRACRSRRSRSKRTFAPSARPTRGRSSTTPWSNHRRRPPLRFGRLLLASLDNRCFAHPGGALRRPSRTLPPGHSGEVLMAAVVLGSHETGGTPPRRSLRPLARVAAPLLAALSGGAAAIHFTVVPEHLSESRRMGIFFLTVAWAQAAWALAIVLRSPTRRALTVGALLNGGVLAVWAVHHTVGIPVRSCRRSPPPGCRNRRHVRDPRSPPRRRGRRDLRPRPEPQSADCEPRRDHERARCRSVVRVGPRDLVARVGHRSGRPHP